jgi:hypothetical protein
MMRVKFCFVVAAAALAGCGGDRAKAAPVADPTTVGSGEVAAADPGAAIQVEGLLGDIPREDVERVVKAKSDAIVACYQQALDVLEQIEGSIELVLTVGADGAVTEAYLRNGSLGSADAEECIAALAKRLVFPRPRGGARAEIVYPIALEEPYGHPAPAPLSGAQAKAVADANAADVARCLAGASGVQLTVYVGRGGAVLSTGATSDSAGTADAATCLAEAARAWAFPDPGGATAKATIGF